MGVEFRDMIMSQSESEVLISQTRTADTQKLLSQSFSSQPRSKMTKCKNSVLMFWTMKQATKLLENTKDKMRDMQMLRFR